MLSVLIETENDGEGLARTLASLVGGAVEGVVREVIVCDRGSTDQTHRVAEHAGCHFVAQGGLAEGVRQAKGDWLMFVEPGARLAESWTEPVLHHMAMETTPARFSRSRQDPASFFARIFSAQTALVQGLVIRKSEAVTLSRKAGSAEALARGVASKRLSGEIRVAEPRQRARR